MRWSWWPKKAHPGSVTSKRCNCGWLQHVVQDTTVPITYEEELHEYHLIFSVNGNSGYKILYHCPFCGGRAGESLRASFFHVVPDQERKRLLRKVECLVTFADAVALLGKPDEDIIMDSPTEGLGRESASKQRTLIYSKLSDVAKVVIVEKEGKVHASILAKRLTRQSRTEKADTSTK